MKNNDNNENRSKKTEGVSYLFTNAKAGMEGLDREQINKIVTEATKGSRMAKKNELEQKKIEEECDKTNKEISNFHKNIILYNQVKAAADLKFQQILKERRLDKIWVHLDMDMFFAAVEIRDNPSLANIPIAVGNEKMISTSNYVARKYGVRSAMPGFIALKLCPKLKFVEVDYRKYKAESAKIMEVLREYDPDIENMGLDEAYIDLTDYCEENNIRTEDEIKKVVQGFKDKIFERTKLTCSCGIACNKMLAKICSDYKKPNGMYFLKFDFDFIENFLRDLSVRKIPFIGEKTERRFNLMGIFKCSDILDRYVDLFFLYGNRFEFYITGALGIGHYYHSELQNCKSISRSHSFSMTSDAKKIQEVCINLSKKVFNDMKKEKVLAKTITVEVIELSERKKGISYTGEKELSTENDIVENALDILEKMIQKYGSMRMVRVKVSGFIRIEDNKSILKFLGSKKQISSDIDAVEDKLTVSSQTEIKSETNESKVSKQENATPSHQVETKLTTTDYIKKRKSKKKAETSVSCKNLKVLLENMKKTQEENKNNIEQINPKPLTVKKAETSKRSKSSIKIGKEGVKKKRQKSNLLKYHTLDKFIIISK